MSLSPASKESQTERTRRRGSIPRAVVTSRRPHFFPPWVIEGGRGEGVRRVVHRARSELTARQQQDNNKQRRPLCNLHEVIATFLVPYLIFPILTSPTALTLRFVLTYPGFTTTTSTSPSNSALTLPANPLTACLLAE
jgi:hypothetical protein